MNILELINQLIGIKTLRLTDTSVALPQIPSSTVMPFNQDVEKRHKMKERDIKNNEKTFLFIYKTKCFVMEANELDLNPQICGPYRV